MLYTNDVANSHSVRSQYAVHKWRCEQPLCEISICCTQMTLQTATVWELNMLYTNDVANSHCVRSQYAVHKWRCKQPLCEISIKKGVPRQAEVAQGVPDRLRPRIFLTFRHYKGGRLLAKLTGRLYPRRNPWYSLSEAESTSEHMVLSGVPRKKSPVTPQGIDPGTVRLVAQRLNHSANPGPVRSQYALHKWCWGVILVLCILMAWRRQLIGRIL